MGVMSEGEGRKEEGAHAFPRGGGMPTGCEGNRWLQPREARAGVFSEETPLSATPGPLPLPCHPLRGSTNPAFVAVDVLAPVVKKNGVVPDMVC